MRVSKSTRAYHYCSFFRRNSNSLIQEFCLAAVYHIIEILHQIIAEIGINTFVINHTVLPSEYFDKKLEITKDAGFSEFTIEEIA